MFTAGKKVFAAAAMAACLCAGAQIAMAAEHSHAHHDAAPQKLTLNHGKKWVTDDKLQQGMAGIRAAMAADLPAIRGGEETAEQYGALANKVDDQIAFIVENCRLDKATDDMLHLALGDVIAGSQAMAEQKSAKARRHGAEKIVRALKGYGDHFEHPGWHNLK